MTNTLNQLRQSVAALQAGRLAEAIRTAQSILLFDPKNFDAHHIVALASYHARDLATAQRHIDRALAIRSDMADAFNTHGLILRASGRTAEAANQFARAVKLNPRGREAHYNLANACHDLGRLPAAVEHYDAALRLEPAMVMAWNNRGLALRKLGRPQEALASLDEALKRAPDFAPAHYNRADALAALQRTEEAIAAYDRAIALKPDLAEAHCNRANVLMQLNRTAEALAGYDRALALQPGFIQALMSRGIALAATGRETDAEDSFRKAIALKPDYADAHCNLGKLLRELGRNEEAVASYDEAIRIRPDHAESHSNRGNVLRELKRYEEALTSYDHAIRLSPEVADAHTIRGNILLALERYEDALVSHRMAVRLTPGAAEVHNNLGVVLGALNLSEDALAAYDRAIALNPDYAAAFNNRGNVLCDLHRPEDALASFDRALTIDPDNPNFRYSKSTLLLQRHDFIEGFDLKRSRWDAEEFEGKLPATDIPAWDGSPVSGEVLLWGEQGLGDEVFYASMLSLIESVQPELALSCDRRLDPIYARSFPKVRLLDRKSTTTSITGNFAAQAALGDIGHLLRVDKAGILARRYPYLVSNVERRREFKASPAFRQGNRVCGLSWRSGNRKAGGNRSLRLMDLAPILKLPGVTFMNLQYGDVAQEIREVRERLGISVLTMDGLDVFGDIEGLMSLIDACDMVLTIDNVTAHLAGAIGKTGIVLVPTGRGRYWYWGGEDPSLWYPSLRLAYQEMIGEWSSALLTAGTLLAEMSSAVPGEG